MLPYNCSQDKLVNTVDHLLYNASIPMLQLGSGMDGDYTRVIVLIT